MSDTLHQEAPEEDKVHFFRCGVCGEMIDCRSLDEVFQHEDHKPHPDITYSNVAKIT